MVYDIMSSSGTASRRLLAFYHSKKIEEAFHCM